VHLLVCELYILTRFITPFCYLQAKRTKSRLHIYIVSSIYFCNTLQPQTLQLLFPVLLLVAANGVRP